MIDVFRYIPHPTRPWSVEPVARQIRSGATITLDPGSYLIVVAETTQHIAVRYPLAIDRKTGRERAQTLDIFQPLQSKLPDGFVYVPPGRFLYGHGRDPDEEAARRGYDTVPMHEREIAAFLVARHETTYREWFEFVDACSNNQCPGIHVRQSVPRVSDDYLSVAVQRNPAGHWQREFTVGSTRYVVEAGQLLVYADRAEPHPQDWRDFPITGVSWDDVQQYLKWLRQRKRIDGADVCTEEQWERAARGADDRLFPHGRTLSPTSANIDATYGRKSAAFGPDVVGSHEQSISLFGVYDMAGNVWEMTRPGVTTGSYTTDPQSGQAIPTRGGSFFHSADNAAAVNRWVAMSGQGAPYTGFRVCATAPVE